MCTLKRSAIEVNHGSVSLQAVEKCKRLATRSAPVVSLFQMNASIVLAHVTLLREAAPTNIACVRLRSVRGKRVLNDIVSRCDE